MFNCGNSFLRTSILFPASMPKTFKCLSCFIEFKLNNLTGWISKQRESDNLFSVLAKLLSMISFKASSVKAEASLKSNSCKSGQRWTRSLMLASLSWLLKPARLIFLRVGVRFWQMLSMSQLKIVETISEFSIFYLKSFYLDKLVNAKLISVNWRQAFTMDLMPCESKSEQSHKLRICKVSALCINFLQTSRLTFAIFSNETFCKSWQVSKRSCKSWWLSEQALKSKYFNLLRSGAGFFKAGLVRVALAKLRYQVPRFKTWLMTPGATVLLYILMRFQKLSSYAIWRNLKVLIRPK